MSTSAGVRPAPSYMRAACRSVHISTSSKSGWGGAEPEVVLGVVEHVNGLGLQVPRPFGGW